MGRIKVGLMIGVMLILTQGCMSVKKGIICRIQDEQSFIDNMGNTLTVEEPYKKIISLYSAHTENLYVMDADAYIMGRGRTSIYPPEAAQLPVYDYRSDPEPLIAAEPDLVLIRPFINRNYPDFVKAIEKAGITTVSLYPSTREEFETYALILGMLTNRENEARQALASLQDRIDAIRDKTDQIPEDEKRYVFFESTKTGYRTVTVDANPAKAIAYAGGINIASDVTPLTAGSTIAAYGIEKLMLHAEDIDVYVSQRGAMNAGGSMISIPQREGFMAIKAVREGNILEINEKLISSPTFRYDKGIREIARRLYPQQMDIMEQFDNHKPLTREDYALMTVMATHTPIFVPSSSHYYEKKHLVHSYGMFADVSWREESFDYIETAVLSSYIRGYRGEDNIEYFDKKGLVTKEDIAYSLYIIMDVKSVGTSINIDDLLACTNPRIVQKIVDNHLMSLEPDGRFHPEKTVTQSDGLAYLMKGMKSGL